MTNALKNLKKLGLWHTACAQVQPRVFFGELNDSVSGRTESTAAAILLRLVVEGGL